MSCRFIRFYELHSLVGLSRSTIWRMERVGKFPARRKLGANSVAWVESEISEWIKQKTEQLPFDDAYLGSAVRITTGKGLEVSNGRK